MKNETFFFFKKTFYTFEQAISVLKSVYDHFDPSGPLCEGGADAKIVLLVLLEANNEWRWKLGFLTHYLNHGYCCKDKEESAPNISYDLFKHTRQTTLNT